MADATMTVTTRARDLASKTLAHVGKEGKTAGQSIAAGFVKAQLAIGALKVALRGAISVIRGITGDVAAEGDRFAKLGKRLGVSVETLSGLAHAAELAGTDIETVGNALRSLNRTAFDASRGTGDAADAFGKLGVSVTDAGGNLKSAEELFLSVGESLSGIENTTEKAALAGKVFGERYGSQLVPLLEQGTGAIREQMAEAERFGNVWTGAQARIAEAYTDSKERLGKAIDGIKKAIGTELLPALSKLADKVSAWLAENRGRIADIVVGAISRLADFLGDAVRMVVYVAGSLADIVAKLRHMLREPEGAAEKALAVVGGPVGLAIKRLSEGAEGAGADYATRWVAGWDSAWAGFKGEVSKMVTDATTPTPSHARVPVTEVTREAPGMLARAYASATAQVEGMLGTIEEKAGQTLLHVRDFAADLGATIAGVATNGFTRFFDSIIFGAESAKEAFRGFALDVVRSLNQIAMQRLALEIFGSIFGAAGTGQIGGGTVDISAPATASGGIALGPQIRLVGEAGPEAIVPLSKANEFGMGGGLSITQNITAPAGVDANAVKSMAKQGILEALSSDYGYRKSLQGRLRRGI